MTHYLLSRIEWDCDGYDSKADCALPATILVINGPEKGSSQYEEFEDVVASEITEIFGFCHKGFKIDECHLNSVRGPRLGGIGWVDAVISCRHRFST